MPKIMVVDDNEEFTSLYEVYLRMEGFEAVAENESSKAMEQAYATRPDLILLDLMMPEPDGFQLCRMLRADPNLQRTPIIIVTALNDEDSRIVALGAGANDYLTKPFQVKELKQKINALLEKSK